MIKVTKRDRESGEKMLKRFSSHLKSRKLPQKFMKLRYFAQKPKKRVVRSAAISREQYRKANAQRRFLGA